MRNQFKLLLIAWVSSSFILCSYLPTAYAEIKVVKKAKKIKGQMGIVKVDGAAVYKDPNFDAAVLSYFPAGKKITISVKLYPGVGGLGTFFKVKLPDKKYGYITDVDVVTQFVDTKSKRRTTDNPDFASAKNEAENVKPISDLRFMGGYIGMQGYSQKFQGQTFGSSQWIVGFRMVGMDVLLDGMPLDFQVGMHWGAPDYYSRLSSTPASGFLLISDLMLPFPIFEKANSVFLLGIGPSITYSSFQQKISNTDFDSQEINLGGVGGLSYGLRFRKKLFVSGGLKYYFEKTQYMSYYISLLKEY